MTEVLADSRFLKSVFKLTARVYLDRVRGFSYDFFINGESNLIQKVVLRFPKLIFFDVGANIGTFTSEIFRYSKESNAHLFELDEDLNFKLKLLFKGPRIRINDFGLSNSNEKTSYFRFPDAPAHNSLIDIDFDHLHKEIGNVNVRTGDSYCRDLNITRINFMKIDVEGWERFVIEGFSQMLTENRIDSLSWEYSYMTANTHWTTMDFFSFLESKGYVCGVVRKNGIQFVPWSYELNDYTSGPNYFACLPIHKDFFRLPISAITQEKSC